MPVVTVETSTKVSVVTPVLRDVLVERDISG